MSLGNIKIEKFLNESIIAIVNAGRDKEISAALKRFAYDRERLKQGKKLHGRLDRLSKKKKRKVADQLKAGEVHRKIVKQARDRYSTYRNVSWVALRKYPALLKTLAMEGKSKRTLSGWMEEARQFYANARANTEVMEKLAGFGVTDADLEEGLRLVGEVEKSAAHHEMLKGEAVRATEERNLAFLEFKAWMRDFKRICRIALADTPQKLEKLGIKIRS
ncbi:MAG: hypothetical protein GTO45_07885 [Candidatus Aminicenantes bacterium]|nr:hypothetical protein [Candidatus Aminicenantes bacterium]NIM78750.1 hypothetical protein [Candidatus Aminicenantes bacterium]NIN18005.1 hypothetical protein [Candidatus Aminicenantes bacterium]NIN41905.1 hypothetical protein [Candidatus Aminicenantes bacterium]NIN84660.1 hypothetical protein [Candidatus Aminicenantes bacterium]